MNWDAIGAIGELVGAIAVFVSLVYLAVQLRQNTRQIVNSINATRLAAFEQNIESGNRSREFFLTHPDLLELYMKGCKSYASLNKSEKVKFGYMVRNVFALVQGGYIRQQLLEHDPDGLVGMSRVVDENIAAPGVREYLQSHELDWRPEFKTFVDQRLKIVSNTY
ncbi:MAG: hypothetical protein R3E50_12340 [Halioglobus sp.]